MHQPEYYTSRPNLLRVAQEIATYKNPERVVNALTAMLAAYAGAEPPTPLPVPEGQTNNERFNALLNSCQNPRAVYDALAVFCGGWEGGGGMSRDELAKAFDCHPSFLEVQAAAGAFLKEISRYQDADDISRDIAIRCALAEVWRQGRIYERDRDTDVLLALSRQGVAV